ncbi:MAG: rRNA pseudouridine synthase [Ruminococcus flavefaciens]|nr:rRNA pseudouridine synthase [Ruminococcus flavefaciens]MCM1228618.1 rRNA pseudouridine synthase [Ruminococcus flavefaciens]
MPQIRLDKFISDRTEFSRSRIKELAGQGKITVDGRAVRKSDCKINPDEACVCVAGERVRNDVLRYILMNKPEGYVSSTDDSDGPSVLELVPQEMRAKGLFPAGRLDKDSVGALLITNDGELAHRILSPKNHIPKIYIVKLAESFQSKYVDLFWRGIVLGDGEKCLPARVRSIGNCDNMAFVELHEGKYHQVKRMFASVENRVEKLMRISVGGLVLPEKLRFGECMELLHKDVENLFRPLDFDRFCDNFFSEFSAIPINK